MHCFSLLVQFNVRLVQCTCKLVAIKVRDYNVRVILTLFTNKVLVTTFNISLVVLIRDHGSVRERKKHTTFYTSCKNLLLRDESTRKHERSTNALFIAIVAYCTYSPSFCYSNNNNVNIIIIYLDKCVGHSLINLSYNTTLILRIGIKYFSIILNSSIRFNSIPIDWIQKENQFSKEVVNTCMYRTLEF